MLLIHPGIGETITPTNPNYATPVLQALQGIVYMMASYAASQIVGGSIDPSGNYVGAGVVIGKQAAARFNGQISAADVTNNNISKINQAANQAVQWAYQQALSQNNGSANFPGYDGTGAGPNQRPLDPNSPVGLLQQTNFGSAWGFGYNDLQSALAGNWDAAGLAIKNSPSAYYPVTTAAQAGQHQTGAPDGRGNYWVASMAQFVDPATFCQAVPNGAVYGVTCPDTSGANTSWWNTSPTPTPVTPVNPAAVNVNGVSVNLPPPSSPPPVTPTAQAQVITTGGATPPVVTPNPIGVVDQIPPAVNFGGGGTPISSPGPQASTAGSSLGPISNPLTGPTASPSPSQQPFVEPIFVTMPSNTPLPTVAPTASSAPASSDTVIAGIDLSTLPSWALPAAIGGIALLFFMGKK